MEHSLTFEGLWWLPTAPDRKCPGRLTFSSEDGGSLEVWDALCHCDGDNQLGSCHETILGLTSAARRISLFDCVSRGRSTRGLGKVQTVTSRYHSGLLLDGAHFESPDEASFSSYNAEFPNLAAWLGDATPDSEWAEGDDGSARELIVRWPIPKSLTLYQAPRFNLNVHTQTGTTPRGSSALNIEQRRILELEFAEWCPINDIWPILRRAQDFLSLAFGEPVYAQSISAVQMGPDGLPHTVALHRWARDPQRVEHISSHRMLFTLQDLKANASSGFNKWFSEDVKGIEALQPFFASLYNDELYTETRFVMLVNALESFHRRTGKNLISPKEEHKKRLNRILEALDSVDQTWLKAHLSRSNEPGLRARLTEVCLRVSPVLERFELEAKGFIGQVTDTRNYLVHYDPALRSKAAKNHELIALAHRTEALCAALLLIELGFPVKELTRMLSRADRYRWFIR